MLFSGRTNTNLANYNSLEFFKVTALDTGHPSTLLPMYNSDINKFYFLCVIVCLDVCMCTMGMQ